MPHLILLHCESNEFYINADYISAIVPAMSKQDRGDVHGSELFLATQASSITVDEPPARILELVRQFNNDH